MTKTISDGLLNRKNEEKSPGPEVYIIKPNTHRRRRRDETVELRRVGGVYMNSQLAHDDCQPIRRCERNYLIQALVLLS